MKKAIQLAVITVFVFFLPAQRTLAQNNLGIGTATPAASAKLDITSTTQGVLIPRMTQAQRNAIASPAASLMIYQTDNTPGYYNYNGSAWVPMQPVPAGGTTGQVLAKVNATDYNVQWVTPNSGASVLLVRATANTAQTLSLGSSTAIPDVATCFGNVSTNVGTAFNSATGLFTAPSDGLYLVTIQALSTNNVQIIPYIDVNNDFANTAAATANDFFGIGFINTAALASSAPNRGQLSATVYLTANQVFSIRFQNATSVVGGIVRTDGATNFTIVKLN